MTACLHAALVHTSFSLQPMLQPSTTSTVDAHVRGYAVQRRLHACPTTGGAKRRRTAQRVPTERARGQRAHQTRIYIRACTRGSSSSSSELQRSEHASASFIVIGGKRREVSRRRWRREGGEKNCPRSAACIDGENMREKEVRGRRGGDSQEPPVLHAQARAHARTV